MGVVFHELIGMDPDPIFIFILKKQAVIELLGPIFSEEPVAVMALPGDVE